MGCRCDVRRCALTVKMAEAAEAPQHRFFCHCCKCETNPKLPVSHVWRVFFFSIPHAALWIIQAHMERGREGFGILFFGEAIFSLLNEQTERIDLLTAGSWIILTGIACSATACLLWWLFVCVKRAHRSYMRKERGGERGSQIWWFTLPYLEAPLLATLSSCLLSTACERRKRSWPGVTTCTNFGYMALQTVRDANRRLQAAATFVFALL